MTWNSFHHRGAVLQSVLDTADTRRDGVLPMELPGVAENFRDELDLLAALHLKWHARLSGSIERALAGQPLDLEAAVVSAWRSTSEQLPGLRMILDRYADSPSDEAMAAALDRAREKEWCRLALAAGLASSESAAAARAGRQVELTARSDHEGPSTAAEAVPLDVDDAIPSLVERIKAALAA
jgi:hypothetical protein